MILAARILSTLLGLIVISKLYLDYRKKNTGIFMVLFWTLTWLAVIVLAVYPMLVEQISSRIGDNNSGVTALFAMAFVFMLFVAYRIYNKANMLEKKLQELVTNLAVEDIKDKK